MAERISREHEDVPFKIVPVVGLPIIWDLEDTDRPDVFRVFLRAPEEARLKTLMERLGLAEAATRRKMHETDSNRAAYIKQLYGRDWCDPDESDLVVNTGRVSYQTAAHMILSGTRERVPSPA